MLRQGCDAHERLVLPSSFPVGEELFAVEARPLDYERVCTRLEIACQYLAVH
jgi:hypothetical protein